MVIRHRGWANKDEAVNSEAISDNHAYYLVVSATCERVVRFRGVPISTTTVRTICGSPLLEGNKMASKLDTCSITKISCGRALDRDISYG